MAGVAPIRSACARPCRSCAYCASLSCACIRRAASPV